MGQMTGNLKLGGARQVNEMNNQASNQHQDHDMVKMVIPYVVESASSGFSI